MKPQKWKKIVPQTYTHEREKALSKAAANEICDKLVQKSSSEENDIEVEVHDLNQGEVDLDRMKLANERLIELKKTESDFMELRVSKLEIQTKAREEIEQLKVENYQLLAKQKAENEVAAEASSTPPMALVFKTLHDEMSPSIEKDDTKRQLRMSPSAPQRKPSIEKDSTKRQLRATIDFSAEDDGYTPPPSPTQDPVKLNTTSSSTKTPEEDIVTNTPEPQLISQIEALKEENAKVRERERASTANALKFQPSISTARRRRQSTWRDRASET